MQWSDGGSAPTSAVADGVGSGSFDVVVVGNGVLGLSIALAVAEEQPDASIAVVGQADRIFGATPAAGAMLGCFGEVTAAAMATPQGRRKHELAIAARALWPRWLDGLGPAPGPIVTTQETVVLLNTVGSTDIDSANFAAVHRALRDAGEPHEEIAVEDVPWLDPDPNARPLRALRLPNEGAVDSGALLAGLTAALAKRGVILVDEDATGLVVRGGRIDGVRLAGATIAAGSVVVAAGMATGRLLETLPELARRVPMVVGGRGVSALLDTVDGGGPEVVLRTPNRAFACGLHVVPRGGGTVYLGATNEVVFSPRDRPTIGEITFLTTCGVHQLRRDLDGAHVRFQVGYRPMAIDGWPLLGPTSVSGLWIATGTYRDGLHLSPLLAKDFARRLDGRPGLVDLGMFHPEREPINPGDRARVVAETIQHTLATGFEVPWHVHPAWPGMIGDLARPAFEALIDALGGRYIPPPELLSVLLKSTVDGGRSDEVVRLRAYYESVHAAWH